MLVICFTAIEEEKQQYGCGSIMARALVQSTYILSSVVVAGERAGQFNGSRKNQRSVRMICDVKFPSLKLNSFVGLRGCNALDTLLVKSGETLHSKVAAATFVRRPRGCRFVPKAMFERFTEKAIKGIMLAQDEARRLGHDRTDPAGSYW
ncbi:hypothetical protein H5410_064356 [Solanum commersonii]|uniref:Clp R domain-containing protein n=2 Tax=Solanum commersonii TaxID=4109 RepID=A0A9J5VZQ7_SOLCO|nr:hypothetical protein H5410_064356 [Solanum commersonii]